MSFNCILQVHSRWGLSSTRQGFAPPRPRTIAALLALIPSCAAGLDSGSPDGSEAVESPSVGVVEESLSGGINDVNDPIRNATVLFGNYCTGTLIRNDMVLGCGHCGVLAEAWDVPASIPKSLANDWRPLGDWQAQTVKITFARSSPACRAADDPRTCSFTAHAIATSENGCVDQILFLLDRQVPATHATPSIVMSRAKFDAIGGLAGHSFRPAGWGTVTGGTYPEYRQTIPLNTAATFRAFGGDPNTFTVNMPAGTSTQMGDSGGGLYWWDPGEQRQYVLGDLQSVSTTPLYFGTFTDAANTWYGADGVPNCDAGTDDIPAPTVSTWIQGRLTNTARNRFSPASLDRWHSSFCSSASTDVCTAGDFDGDGDADLVRFSRNGSGGVAGNVTVGASRRWRSWNSSPVDTGFAVSTWATSFATGGESVAVGDVNGDGKDDIVRFERSGSFRVIARTSTAATPSPGTNDPGTPGFSAESVMMTGTPVCQTDGTFCQFAQVRLGGAEELVEVAPSTGDVRVFGITVSGTTLTMSLLTSYSLAGACPSATCTPLLGDADGDGLADLVLIPWGGSTIPWRRSTGTAWATSATWTSTTLCASGALCRVADVDGDRRADLVRFSAGNVRVRRLIGVTGTTESDWLSTSFCSSSDRGCLAVDVTGDGLADVVSLRGEGTAATPTGDVYVSASIALRTPFYVDPRTGRP